jgi:hypothetical protein
VNSRVIRAAFGLAIQWGISSMYAQAPVTGAGGPVTAVAAPSRANTTKVETEVIEINDFAAFPSEITRKPGKFFLLLVNKIRNKQTAFVFDALGAPAAVTSGLAKAVNLTTFQQLKHTAGLLDLPPGEYHLNVQGTGTTLLKIIIQ